jgi:hypothetical protein
MCQRFGAKVEYLSIIDESESAAGFSPSRARVVVTKP